MAKKTTPVEQFKEKQTGSEKALQSKRQAAESVQKRVVSANKESKSKDDPSSSVKAEKPGDELTNKKSELLNKYGIEKKKELRDKHISVFLTQTNYQRLKRVSQEAEASVNGIINGLVEDFLDNFESAEGM